MKLLIIADASYQLRNYREIAIQANLLERREAAMTFSGESMNQDANRCSHSAIRHFSADQTRR